MNPERLQQALLDADLRILVMVVFHLSGDRRWLAPPYLPERDVRLISPEDAGFPPQIRDEIRAAAFGLLTGADPTPKIIDPGDALILEMMRACLAEKVPAEYAPMMREELGFSSRGVEWSGGRTPQVATECRV